MFNSRIDDLTAMVNSYRAMISAHNYEVEGLTSLYRHLNECEQELTCLYKQGYYGTADKRYIVNA